MRNIGYREAFRLSFAKKPRLHPLEPVDPLGACPGGKSAGDDGKEVNTFDFKNIFDVILRILPNLSASMNQLQRNLNLPLVHYLMSNLVQDLLLDMPIQLL